MSNVEARLDALVQQMGVTVIETSKLGSTLNACFHQPTHTIFVRFGLDPVTRTCAIAHELGHAHYGHDCSHPRAEREADEWAARTLLSVEDVERAAYDCEASPAAMAAELGVTPHLLALWGRLYKAGRIKDTQSCLTTEYAISALSL